MYKTIVAAFFILFMFGCSSTTQQVPKPNVKVFEQEDTYILFALRAEEVKNYKVAAELFLQLYEKAHKKEYLYRGIQNLLLAQEYTKALDKITILKEEGETGTTLTRFEAIALFEKGQLQEAELLAKQLAKKTKNPDDYILTSDILIKEGKNDLALKYLESAYMQEYNEKILDKMAMILYVNLHRKKDAIAELESHVEIHGCSTLTCKALLRIYSNENDVDGLLKTYKRIYAINGNKEIAKKIIQIYVYKREFVQLMSFLENSGANDKVLLELYRTAKNYKKAYRLSLEIYKKTKNPEYLGQAAIYEYEAYKDNLSREILDDVIEKLTKVVSLTHEPLYTNYLGYILIDHEIDINKGIEYIKDVLKIQPDSAYYLDSLAWGYYKLGKCKEAYTIMKKLENLKGGDDPEVLKHKQEIQKCIQNPHHKKVVQKR